MSAEHITKNGRPVQAIPKNKNISHFILPSSAGLAPTQLAAAPSHHPPSPSLVTAGLSGRALPLIFAFCDTGPFSPFCLVPLSHQVFGTIYLARRAVWSLWSGTGCFPFNPTRSL